MKAAEWGLLEREGECAAITQGLRRAAEDGSGCLLVIEGPAGIGKTRLLAEVRAQAAAAGMTVGSARAAELEKEFAFGVVRQLFEHLWLNAESAQDETLWAGPATQARKVFASADLTADPVGDFAILHGLFWLTANACEANPVVLLIDDLQWCDAPSLRYLAYLQPRLEELGVLAVAGLRSGEQGTEERLLQRIIADPTTQVLQPRALSSAGTGSLLGQAMGTGVDPAFASACHRATDGNPLLLRELVRTIAVENLAPSADNSARVVDLGPRAVARLVAVRMARVSPDSVRLAQAVAVLGEDAELQVAAALAGQETEAALGRADELGALEIMRIRHDTTGAARLAFVHPLVQSAVYATINSADRATAHRKAAGLLIASGGRPERVASHMLHTLPTGDTQAAAVLRVAAEEAIRCGSPDSAYAYLRRCLEEPLAADQRLEVLLEAGQAAFMVDLEAAASHLLQAHERLSDPVERARIAAQLGTTYLYMLQVDQACAVWSDARAEALTRLPAAEEGTRRRLEAALINVPIVVPGRSDLLAPLPQLRQLPAHDSIGARMLDCTIACHDMAVCDPAAVPRARNALADGSLIEQVNGESAVVLGWYTLLAADDDTVMASLDAAVKQAHTHGSLQGLSTAYCFRALAWLWRGQLTEAHRDITEALRTAEIGHVGIITLVASSYLADTLMEQGQLREAEQPIDAVAGAASSAAGPVYWPLDSRARLLRLRGEHEAAVAAALAAATAWEAHGLHNPALGTWRSEAALSLHALGRLEEAREIAAKELRLARKWSAPRALGRALRVNGTVLIGDEGLELLREATDVLDGSPARLEQAKALAAFGSALHRAELSSDAREPLRLALEIATSCGAHPLAEQIRADLVSTGARPRRFALKGPQSLTPSERRVAEMAARQGTNRQIAENLFITPKTVEVHLGNVYRKLGITTRAELAEVLGTDTVNGTPDTELHLVPASGTARPSP